MFLTIIEWISALAIPLVLLLIPLYAYYKKIKVYEVFVEGAKEGFNVAVKIMPFLVAILVSVGIFRASGALDYITTLLAPVTTLIGMPPETIPMAFMMPLSGSGAIGVMTDLLSTYGPDSFIGLLTSSMMGSTETTFYILAVYFGSVGVKNGRHTLPAALAGNIAGILGAVLISNLVFR
ncbi:MAG: spore maturation protein [Candidatus Marinimicrobia bacterium]|nr:spore maturation protein [Candidatus Neomarinimicrobiota bacterium]